MAWNHIRVLGAQFSFDDMEVGAANTTGTDSQKNMSGFELRRGDFRDSQRTLQNGLGRAKDGGFHAEVCSHYDARGLAAVQNCRARTGRTAE
jgi:hypothetical protein